MSVPEWTLLAGPSVAARDLEPGTFVYTWVTSPVSKAATATPVGETTDLLEVATWFSGCRNCNHKNPERAKKGMSVQVASGTEFMLKNGSFVPVEELAPGQRLLAIGCKCGYEEVKEVRAVSLSEPVMLYEISPLPNYGITDGSHVLVVRGP